MNLNDIRAKATELGPDRQAELHINCQRQGRHDLNANEDQLEKLPMVTVGPDPTWRYCPECWSVFDADGELVVSEPV